MAGFAASITAYWAAGQLQPHAALQWAAGAAPILAGLLGAFWAACDEPVTITWDGQSWHLQGSGAGTPVLALDAGAWLLLRWHSLPGGPPPRWIHTRIAPQSPGETRLKVMMLLRAGGSRHDSARPAAESTPR